MLTDTWFVFLSALSCYFLNCSQELERVARQHKITVHFPPKAHLPPLVPQCDLEKGVSPDGDGSASSLTEKIAALKRDLAQKQPHFQIDGVRNEPKEEKDEDDKQNCSSENEEPSELPDFSSTKTHGNASGHNTSDAESMHSSDTDHTSDYGTAQTTTNEDASQEQNQDMDLSSHVLSNHFSYQGDSERRDTPWDQSSLEDNGSLEHLPEPNPLTGVFCGGMQNDGLIDENEDLCTHVFEEQDFPFQGEWNDFGNDGLPDDFDLSNSSIPNETFEPKKRPRLDDDFDTQEEEWSPRQPTGGVSGASMFSMFPTVLLGLVCLVCLASLPSVMQNKENHPMLSPAVGSRSLMGTQSYNNTVSQPLLDLLRISDSNGTGSIEQLNEAIFQHGRNDTFSSKNSLRGTRNLPSVVHQDTDWKHKAFLSGSVHGQNAARTLSHYLVDYLSDEGAQLPRQGELLEHFVPEQHITGDDVVSYSQLYTDAALWSYSQEILGMVKDSEIWKGREEEVLKKSLVPFESSEQRLQRSSNERIQKCTTDRGSESQFSEELVRQIGQFSTSQGHPEQEKVDYLQLRLLIPDKVGNDTPALLLSNDEDIQELNIGKELIIPFEGSWYDLTCRIESVHHMPS